MAGIVNNSLAVFRRSESTKPLHTRWGDVAISVPTDGSWNQYENPHRARERQLYGPGFVPDCSPSDWPRESLGSHRTKGRAVRSGNIDEASTSIMAERSSDGSTSRRGSLSLGGLRSSRLSVRLASRPMQLRGEVLPDQGEESNEQKKSDFAYKPIHQDYPSEISDTSTQSKHRYRYIPTNGRYFEEIPSPHSSRSQSAMSVRSANARRDSYTDSLESYERERGRAHARHHGHPSHFVEDDRVSMGPSVGGSSESPRPGSSTLLSSALRSRRKTSPFVAADRTRSSFRPMTIAMVPDPEDIYD